MRPDARGIYTARVRGQVKETEFAEEINAAHALAVYVREVKRRCLALPHEDDGDFGVSLYEVTKRVLETGTRRRECLRLFLSSCSCILTKTNLRQISHYRC